MIEYNESHLRFFETATPQKAAEIIYKLRHGEWPEELPDKPEEWDSMSDEDALKWSDIVNFYAAEVGEKVVLSYQLKAEKGLSDEEIDKIWDSKYYETLDMLHVDICEVEELLEVCQRDMTNILNNLLDIRKKVILFGVAMIVSMIVHIIVS